MAIATHEFVGEMCRRGLERGRKITQGELARELGESPSAVSAMLRCPSLPDRFREALDRIAPAEPEAVGSR